MRRNYQKHTNANPLHRWLLRRFHTCVAGLVQEMGNWGAESKVLDVGSGEGFVLDFLQGRGIGARLVGMDADRAAFAQAVEAKVDRLVGSAASLPFGDGAFPLVLCLEVLEHLDQPQLAIEELGRVCCGHIIVSVPNQPFFAAANFLRAKNIRTLGEDPEHLHHWTGARFLKLVSGSLQIERVEYPFPWAVVVCRK
ncbi:MAG: class I SAM-dependent methyltransferase [Chloroflexi bacterium]|nr:class I SAM-dependent methyltransferase [Chloroflexota bacterium]